MVIAIDGYSSCGKSTIAKELARRLDLIYVDTGAMYRAVTLYFLRHQVDLQNDEDVQKSLKNISISFQRIDGNNTTFLNEENVEEEIRSLKVSSYVSEVSTIQAVREKLVKEQRAMASDGLIMDGRDIATVVFPNADFKFFLTAEPAIRAQRRFDELMAKGLMPDIVEVRQNLEHRDYIDTHRDHSPLKKAEDAILIDNSHMTREEQIDVLLEYIHMKVNVE